MCTALRLVALVGVLLCSFSISISSQSTIPIPGKIEVENYTNFYDLTPGNAGGACRTDNVDLYVTWDPPDGGCNLGHTQATEWLSFTINVSQANTYVLSARVAHPGVGGTFHVEVDGVDVTGAMTVPDTVDWGEWRTIRKHGIALTAGQHTLKLVMDSVNPTTFSVGDFNYLALTRSAPFGGTARAVPGKIEMEDFDINADGGVGELAAYHDVTPANLGDATYRFPEAVDIATTGDVGGGFQVGWTEDGEWLAYSVYFYTQGGYRLSMRVAHPGQGGTFHMEVDGVPVTGPIQIPDTGGFSNWQTITALTGPISHGDHVIYLVLDTTSSITGAVANVNYFELTPDQTFGVSASTSSTGAAVGIDGWPFFMLGFSYFGALGHDPGTIRQVFNLAANPKFPTRSGVPPGLGPEFNIARIFPNWWENRGPRRIGETPLNCNDPNLINATNVNGQRIFRTDTLFQPDGSIHVDTWLKLKGAIDAAKEIGLFIQLSMAIEPVARMGLPAYATAMRELAVRLSDYKYTDTDNTVLRGALWVALEVQNEFDLEALHVCKERFTPEQMRDLIRIVRDPRPAGQGLPACTPETPKNVPCEAPACTPETSLDEVCDAPRFTTLTFGGDPAWVNHVRTVTGVDFVAFEETRDTAWDDVGQTYSAVKRVRDGTQNAIAIGLGETLPFDQAVTDFSTENWTADDWWRAAREAKRAGAGFWYWHTRGLFLWDQPHHNPNDFYPTEVTVLENLRQQVNSELCWGRRFPIPPSRPPGVPCP